MEFWTFLTVVILAGIGLEAYRVHVKGKKAQGGANLADIEARLAALEADGALEDRVRTLEAIVTDSRYQLDSEIKSLDGSPSRADSRAPD